MDAYSITCTTCQAKLRVRDAAAIGQILTCPKCGSMVLVEAPTAAADESHETTSPATGAPSPPPRPRTTTFATSAEASPDHSVARAPASAAETTSAESESFAHDLADTVDDLTGYGSVPTSSAATDSASPAGVADESDEVTSGDGPDQSLPPPDWSASGARFPQRMVLAGVAGVSGALLGVVLLVWLASGRSQTDSPVAAPGALEGSASDLASAASSPPSPDSPPPDSPDVTNPIASPESPPLTKAEKASNGPSPLTPDASEPSPDGASAPPKVSPEPPAAEPSQKVDAASDPPLPSAPPEFAAETDERKRADRLSGSGSLAETLRKLGGFFESDESNSEAAPTEPPDIKPVEEPAPSEPPEPIAMPRPAPRVIDVAARLADPIPEIEFNGVPLIDFLRFVTSYSTIPITLDADSLLWLSLTPASPVAVQLKDTTVGGLLDAALGKMGLTHQVVNQQLRVTRKPSSDTARRKVNLSIADLVQEDAAQVKMVQDHILALVAPGSWGAEGGTGSLAVEGTSLVVEHREDVLFDVIRFCEKLRVARGLPTKSKYDPKHFQLASRTARARPQLEKTITLNYPRPSPLVRILNRFSKEADLSIIVDWQALDSAGWNPDGEATVSAAGEPVGAVLDLLLEPMELTYRIVDDGIVEVTTPAALLDHADVEFYPLDASRGDAAVELPRIVERLPADWFSVGGGKGEIRLDPPSRCLIARLSQPQHQVLEKELGGMPGE